MHLQAHAWPVFCCSGRDTFTLLAVSLSLADSLGLTVRV